MPPLEATGMVVRAARVKRGWTQQHAAAEAGVSRKQWALLEKGENVSVVFLRKVARSLDLQSLSLGEGLEGNLQSAGNDALAIAEIANELVTTAERLRALAFESMLPPSLRGNDAAAISDFIHAQGDLSAEDERRFNRALHRFASELANAKPDARTSTARRKAGRRREG